MPLAAPPLVGEGDDVLATQLDALLLAADQRLQTLFGHRSWFTFDLSGVPAQQIPPLGIVYVLTDDAARTHVPSPGTPDPSGNFNWPEKYVYADHVAEVESMALEGLDDLGVAWEVSGTYSANGYVFGEAHKILVRTSGGSTLPVRRQGDYEPDRFCRYGLADVIVNDPEVTSVGWDSDRIGVARIHNLTPNTITVGLGGDQETEIGPWGIRCIRRLGRTEPWLLDEFRYYFPQAVAGDVPIWDCDPNAGRNQVIRSQSANPIFRLALVQSMFRPQAVSRHDPGMFSKDLVPMLNPPVGTALLAECVADHGEIEVIRMNMPSDTEAPQDEPTRHTWSYTGGLVPTPAALADLGLSAGYDDDERGVVLSRDLAVPEPEDGNYGYLLVSRGSNLTGQIVSQAIGQPFRAFFQSAADADAWFLDLFGWPTYGSTPVDYAEVEEITADWTPDDPGELPDYAGSWTETASVIHRAYRAQWTSTAYGTISPWNLWKDTLNDHQPGDSLLVRQVICMAICLQEPAEFWNVGSGGAEDDACVVDVIHDREAALVDLSVNGQPIGLGTHGEDGWTEPRWRLHLLPTIGYDPQRSWEALGFRGSEEIVWTPYHPLSPGYGTVTHYRVRDGAGAAAGAPWSWDYRATTNLPAENALAPQGIVPSGMTFWRLFWIGTRYPAGGEIGGEASPSDPYPGFPSTGPQPWRIRDHGWLLDRLLEGGAEIRNGQEINDALVSACLDGVPIGGWPGEEWVREAELQVGMQIRMAADTFNQVAKFVAGISHIRPCGWEHAKHGLSARALYTSGGWELVGQSQAAYCVLQPYGAVHIYGHDLEVDEILDGIGVARREATCPELEALGAATTIESVEDVGVNGWEIQTITNPYPALDDTVEWCSADDIAEALLALGWLWSHARLVQPVELVSAGPEQSMVTSWLAADAPPEFKFRARPGIGGSCVVAIPDAGATPTYQLIGTGLVGGGMRIAQTGRPFRAPVFTQTVSDGGTPAVYTTRLYKLTTDADVSDALSRTWDDADPVGPRGSLMWFARVIGTEDGQWPLVAMPMREPLYDFPDDASSGPESTTEERVNVPVVRPDDTPRTKWLTVAPGDTVGPAELEMSATWPDGHHTWELFLLRARPTDLSAI